MKTGISQALRCAAAGLLWTAAAAPAQPGSPVVLAVCHPVKAEIRNIEELYERSLLPVDRLRLVGVFHEDEREDYAGAREYAAERGLSWVSFDTVRGRVPDGALFRENSWTPVFRRIFESTDGILFTGGADIPPALYGMEESLLTEPSSPARSRYEISFLFHLVGGSRNPEFTPFLEGRREYPVLAVCLGLQSLNVAAGGTLVQDIPFEVYGLRTVQDVLRLEPDRIHSAAYAHRAAPGGADLFPHFHRIRLEAGRGLARLAGVAPDARPLVLSSHHQAAGSLGQNLSVGSRSLDGRVVESLEHLRFPGVLAVQFHPEASVLYRRGGWASAAAGGSSQSPRTLLESEGVSLDFHRGIWAWFGRALSESARRTAPRGAEKPRIDG